MVHDQLNPLRLIEFDGSQLVILRWISSSTDHLCNLRLMRRGVPTPDYAELAMEALGSKFALLAHGSSLTELLTFNCMNLICLGKGLVSVFPALSMETAMCLCIAICVGLSAVPDRHFSYIALISALALLAAEGLCFLGGLELSQWEPCPQMGAKYIETRD